MLKTINDANYTRDDYLIALEKIEAIIESHDESNNFPLHMYEEDAEKILNLLEEAYGERTSHNIRNYAYRRRKRYYKLKRLYNETKHSWRAPVVLMEGKGALKRVHYSGKRKRFEKKVSNRAVRRASNRNLKKVGHDLPNGNQYKKIYESWNIED